MDNILLIGAVAIVGFVLLAEILHRVFIRSKAGRSKKPQGKDKPNSDWRAGLR